MIWIESIPGNTTVANNIVKIIELARGTVRTAIEVRKFSNIPGIYPMKKSIKAPPAQKR
jgi:hypothetical protein